MTALQFGIVSLFPDIFDALNYGIVGRALKRNLIQLTIENPRDYTLDKHQSVDDKPFGGGPGMVMRPQPLVDAINACQNNLAVPAKRIYLSPQGKPLTHDIMQDLSKQTGIILVCGRYEGIDQRVIDTAIDVEYSLGDYVLSGGEFAALTMIDAITRLIPSALGDEQSAQADSFVEGLLDYPHYTRPESYEDQSVPDVLLSGNHQAIARWRFKQALGQTLNKRPDLLSKKTLTFEEKHLLNEYQQENEQNLQK